VRMKPTYLDQQRLFIRIWGNQRACCNERDNPWTGNWVEERWSVSHRRDITNTPNYYYAVLRPSGSHWLDFAGFEKERVPPRPGSYPVCAPRGRFSSPGSWGWRARIKRSGAKAAAPTDERPGRPSERTGGRSAAERPDAWRNDRRNGRWWNLVEITIMISRREEDLIFA